VAIGLSEDDITDLRVLDGFCWGGVSTTGVVLLADFCITAFRGVRRIL
jgi:hypothetical protein